MAEIESLNHPEPEELCSRVFIKKKPFLAKLNGEILSWCRCETSNTTKGSLFVCILCSTCAVVRVHNFNDRAVNVAINHNVSENQAFHTNRC